MTTRLTEDELIATLFAPIAGEGGLGLKDDAALLRLGAENIVLTADALVAGVHFFPDDPPAAIAKKALRVNLSDLAAKGAEPKGFLLTIALPPGWTNEWLAALAQGLAEDAQTYGCPLLGGDTVATPGPLTLSITAIGEAPQGRFVPRTGARPGDSVYVTGTIGDAALGLLLRRDASLAARLSASAREFLLGRYLSPQPRLGFAPALRTAASAAMDVSDGLCGDLAKLARASNASACVELARVPLSDPARELLALEPKLFERAMTGGDDYELLFCSTVPEVEILRLAQACGARCTKIGEILKYGAAPTFLDAEGKPVIFSALSFNHF